MYQFCGLCETAFGSCGAMFGGPRDPEGPSTPHPVNQLIDNRAIAWIAMNRRGRRLLYPSVTRGGNHVERTDSVSCIDNNLSGDDSFNARHFLPPCISVANRTRIGNAFR